MVVLWITLLVLWTAAASAHFWFTYSFAFREVLDRPLDYDKMFIVEFIAFIIGTIGAMVAASQILGFWYLLVPIAISWIIHGIAIRLALRNVARDMINRRIEYTIAEGEQPDLPRIVAETKAYLRHRISDNRIM